MIDLVRVKIQAGNGGSGAVSFFKLLNMRYGKPDGGDGGNGGNVFVKVNQNIYDLENFRGKNLWRAEDGENGRSQGRKGKEGNDLEIFVPQGTIMKVNFTTPKGETQTYFYDFKNVSDVVMVAKGGLGGRGNSHARFRRDPKGKKATHWDAFNKAQMGRPGEFLEVSLELKYLAQVGLIGLPNAGKSSLLSVLTNAKPKIADYPFTTLEPNVGVFETDGSKIAIADIPGVIEGASTGKGLGLTFLRHIERTNLLVHVLDGTNASKGVYKTVKNELKLYNKTLLEKKEIVVINKIDLLNSEQIKALKKEFVRLKPLYVSAVTGEGVEKLKENILKYAVVTENLTI